MKQIKIITFNKNEKVSEEIFYINNMDCFIRDCIEDLIQSRIMLNKVVGDIFTTYDVKVNDVVVSDNYELYKYFKAQIDYTKENVEKFKKHNEKLVKVMNKWYL